jgi:inner membrane transporter RhtA
MPVRVSAYVGTPMVLASMSSVQLGAAASVGLFDQIGAVGAAWLRLLWGGIVLFIAIRPWRRQFTRSDLITCASLGIATAGMTVLFMIAISRLPLGTASALEFLGPLAVATASGGTVARLWALIAGGGVLLLTTPWSGSANPAGVTIALGAAACWAGYIVLTRRAGDAMSGVWPLAISMPIAALSTTLFIAPTVVTALSWHLLVAGLGLALLMPVAPLTLELFALRRLTVATFGTLMSLEPAIALIVGLVVLGQTARVSGAIGIALVVAAGIGATRTGSRAQPVTAVVADRAF